MNLNILPGFYIWILAALIFWGLAGMSDGLVETTTAHYSAFKDKCPTCSDQYWDKNQSWTNKYASVEKLSPRFIFSTTALVWLTDAYHLFRALTGLFMLLGWLIACMSFLQVFSRIGFWSLPAIAGAWYLAKAVGFHLVYTIIF